MKPLLIYNKNISSALSFDFEEFGDGYDFEIGKQESLNENFSIDSKIDEILHNQIGSKKYSVIFIPYSLSDENYIELIGLRFACHIRLSKSFLNSTTPIVFYGLEKPEHIARLSDLGSILFTDRVYSTDDISIDNFKKIIANKQPFDKEINGNEFIYKFISRVSINPSGNYASHHSIANEWSIYRWALFMNITDGKIKNIESKIGANLYFKYLKNKFQISDIIKQKKFFLEKQGRILYIDDEIGKGWDIIFGEILKNQEHDFLGYEFADKSQDEIVTLAVQKIKDFDPDIIILDYRLHDDDFENLNPAKITGFRILENIKQNINKGIQVIIFSATNKIWNLKALQKSEVDGFILKEAPENSIDEEFTLQTIKNVYTTLEEGLQMSFLKTFYKQFQPIKTELIKRKNFKVHPSPLPKDFVDEVIKWVELSNENLARNKNDFGITSSFLSYFSIIENITNRLIDVDNPIYVDTIGGQKKYNFQFRTSKQNLMHFQEVPTNSGLYIKTNTVLLSTRNIPWFLKILNAFDFISEFNINTQAVSSLLKKRHAIIHSNTTTGDKIEIHTDELINLYNYIIAGLDKIK